VSALEAQRLALHAAGKLDAEIAQAERGSKLTIRNWRYRRGLPGNERHSLTAEAQRTRLLLHALGSNDYAMARQLGVNRSTVTRWRARTELAPHRRWTRANGEVGPSGLFSLDALDRAGRAYVDRLADDRCSSWLEEMGATVW